MKNVTIKRKMVEAVSHARDGMCLSRNCHYLHDITKNTDSVLDNLGSTFAFVGKTGGEDGRAVQAAPIQSAADATPVMQHNYIYIYIYIYIYNNVCQSHAQHDAARRGAAWPSPWSSLAWPRLA